MSTTHPRQEPLQTKSVSTVYARAIPPLIGIPVVWLTPDGPPLVCLHQFIIVLHPHAAAKNLSNARHEHVDRLCDTTITLVFPHVERFDLNWEVSEEDRYIEDVRHLALGGFRDVVTEMVRVAVFIRDVVFDKPGNSIGILHPFERSRRRLEVWVQLFDIGGDGWVCQGEFKDAADDCLYVLKQVFKSDKIELGFDVCVLRQVTAARIFRRGRRARHRTRPQVRADRFRDRVARIV
jgi:hypothetical protein